MSRITDHFNMNRGRMRNQFRMNRSYASGFPTKGFLRTNNHPMNPILTQEEDHSSNPAFEQAAWIAQREAGFRNGGGAWFTKLALQDHFSSLMDENRAIKNDLQSQNLSPLDRQSLVRAQQENIRKIHEHNMVNEMIDERTAHKRQMRHLNRAHKRQMRQQRSQRIYAMMGMSSPYMMAGGMSPYNPFGMGGGAFGAPPPYTPFEMGAFGAPPAYSPYGMGMGATPYGYNMAANMYDPSISFNQPYHHMAPPPYDAPPAYADARESVPHQGETALHLPSLGSYYIPLDTQHALTMLTNEYKDAGSDILKRYDARQKLAYYLQANIHHFMPSRNYRTGKMLAGTPDELQKIMHDLTAYTPNEGARLVEDKLSMLGILRNRDEIEGVQKYLTRPAIDRYKRSFIQLANLLPVGERNNYRQMNSICERLRAIHEPNARNNPQSRAILDTMHNLLVNNMVGGVFPTDEAPERGVFPKQFEILEQVLNNHGQGQSVSKYLDLLSETIPANATSKLYDIKAKINDEHAYIFTRASDGETLENVAIRDFVSYPSYLCDMLGEKFKTDNRKTITFNQFNMKDGKAGGMITVEDAKGARHYDVAAIQNTNDYDGNAQNIAVAKYAIKGAYDNIFEQTKKHADAGKPTVRVDGNSKTHFRLGAFLKAENSFAHARVADVRNPLLKQQNGALFGMEGMGA